MLSSFFTNSLILTQLYFIKAPSYYISFRKPFPIELSEILVLSFLYLEKKQEGQLLISLFLLLFYFPAYLLIPCFKQPKFGIKVIARLLPRIL